MSKVYFYTTHPGGEVATQVGYKYNGFVGYIDTKQITGTKPLHRWYDPFNKSHFYTDAIIHGVIVGATPIISNNITLPQAMVIRR